MKRIDFFKHIVLGSISLSFLKSSEGNASKGVREIRLSSPCIAGFHYYQGKEVENQLREGDQLSLKREPQNRYDRNAVEVYLKSKKLGYLPRKENKIIARMMDQGINIKGRLMKINFGSAPYQKVMTEIFYEEAQLNN
ncbi:MAG: HIRAN domain-containing protein [Mangrovibacterium sp.]